MQPGSGGWHGQLFGQVLTTDAMSAATSDSSWFAKMLRFEVALAAAEGAAGLVPPWAVEEIKACCTSWREPDLEALGAQGRLSGTPAVAFVAALRERLGGEAGKFLHFGATSQDLVDTAMMLVLQEALGLVASDGRRAARAAAALAERYRSTPAVARTVLKQALPTTFGRKAAGWLVAFNEAGEGLARVAGKRLAVQLGGPAGTLSALGGAGPSVVEHLSAELGLTAPVLPWHTDRTRVVEAAGALAIAAGVAAKVALDVALLMQDEIGEVAEPMAPGRGGSSSMPHKRNPAMATAVNAAWRRASGLHNVLLAAMVQENERAAGAWQAEPETVSDLCRATGGAVCLAADILAGLEVHSERMAHNLAGAAHVDDAVRCAEVLVDRALAEHGWHEPQSEHRSSGGTQGRPR
ncbi:MAG TPA: lyase family protein [Acidimicrobiales bacterium]|nr:lyase family protein [Acidimicrobiales bacterium]